MKFFVWPVVAILALCAPSAFAAEIGQPAPDFRFEVRWNTSVAGFSDFIAQGKITIVEQFATW